MKTDQKLQLRGSCYAVKTQKGKRVWFSTLCITVQQQNTMGLAVFFHTHIERMNSIMVFKILRERGESLLKTKCKSLRCIVAELHSVASSFFKHVEH